MNKIIRKDDFLKKNKILVFKEGPKQILLLGVEDKIFAIDNRCPHEGYPLSQGNVDGKACVLTCNWHNWKFDLETGKCLLGGDNVKTYPVNIEGDEIIVDLSGPTLEEIKESIIDGLKIAFEKRQYGRTSREIARLVFNKIDPMCAIEKAIEWSFDKFEFGMNHAYGALADWIFLYHNSESLEDKVICLTEAIDHISHDTLRAPSFPFGNKEVIFSEEAFLQAIEKEDTVLAESMVQEFFGSGQKFQDLEKILSKAALSHYSDFGHSLIYVVKCSEISRTFDKKEVDLALALNVTRGLCYSTREDLLPEFKNYKKTLEDLKQMEFGTNDDEFRLTAMSISKAYEWLLSNFSNKSFKNLYDGILRSCAENLLKFDMKYQSANRNPVVQNVGWLDFTHGITFSNAVRKTCEKYPELWTAGILQMISFFARNTPYLDNHIRLDDWRVSSIDEFENIVKEKILDHGLAVPIISVHVLKTSLAVFEEIENCSLETKSYLLASLNRFLQSPIKQKDVRRTVFQSMSLVKKDFE